MRPYTVGAQVTYQELRAIRALAKRRGVTVSQFLGELLRREITFDALFYQPARPEPKPTIHRVTA